MVVVVVAEIVAREEDALDAIPCGGIGLVASCGGGGIDFVICTVGVLRDEAMFEDL